jgi:imidazolonepropionase-like amidohydrolase
VDASGEDTRPASLTMLAVVPPSGTVTLRAGRLVDVAAEEILEDQAVTIRGELIESVEPWSEPTSAAGSQVIDLSAFTVLPGLFDCHTHLADAAETSSYVEVLTRTGAQQAFIGVENARATLTAGFTSVRDVGTFRAFVDVALRDAIDADVVPGPRMACAGAYITVITGGGEITGLAPDIEVPRELRFGVVSSIPEIRARVRELLNRGASLIKVIATGAVLAPGTKPGVPEFTEEEIRAAVEQAAAYGVFVVAHAHGAEGIKNAIRAGVRSIDHGSLMDDEAIAMMAEHRTFLVADIYNGDFIATEGREQGWPMESLRKNEETTRAQREGFRKAVAAGVRIAYGTDAGVYPHGKNARQLPYMVRHGMSPIQAIQSATIRAAELMGWEERLGSIESGKLADVIAVRGDALSDLESFAEVPFVMKGGAVFTRPD